MSDRDLNIKVALSASNKLSTPVAAAQRSAAGLASQIKATQETIRKLQGQSKTFEQLSVAVKKDAAAYEKAKAKVKALRDQFPKLNQQTDAQKKALAAARLERGRFSRALDKERQKLKAVTKALHQQGISTKHTDGITAQIVHRTEQYNRQLSEQKRRLNAVTHAQNQYAKAKEVRNKLAQKGAVAVASGSGVVYGGARFLKPGFDFDMAMSEVQARTGLTKDSAQMKALREQAKQIGASDIYNAKDAAAGQKFLAMAGFTPESIRAALPAVLKMGLAGDMGLGDAADRGANVLAKFGLSADQMTHLADVYSVTLNRGKTNMGELSEAMVKASPTARQLGMDLESLSAMMGILSQNDIKGGSAGTLLSGGLMKLVTPVKKGKNAIEALGVSVNDSHGRLREMGDILGDVGKQLHRFNEVSQTRILKDLFGAESAPGMKALIDAVERGDFKALRAELKGAAGEAQKLADIKADNLPTDILLLGSAWEALRIEVAETVTNALRPLIQTLARVLDKVTAWAKAHPQLTKTIVLGGLALGVLVATLGALALALAAVIVPLAAVRFGLFMLTGGGGIGGLVGSVKKALPWFGRLIGVVSRFTGVTTLARGAAIALGGTIGTLTLPVTLLVAAIVAAGVLIYKYWQPIKAFFGGFWEWIAEKWAPVGQFFKRVFAPLKPLFDWLSNALSKVWKWFKDLFEPVQLTGEELKACADMGKRFGEKLTDAVMMALTPFRALYDLVCWTLEKLGLIPSAAEKAAKAAGLNPQENDGFKILTAVGNYAGQLAKTDQQRQAQAQSAIGVFGAATGAFGKALTEAGKKATDKAQTPPVTPPFGKKNYNSGGSGLGRGLGESDKTEKRDRDKLGEIVFKHRPDVMKLRGMYQEPLITQKSHTGLLGRFKGLFNDVVNPILPQQNTVLVPIKPERPARELYQPEYNTIELHIHGVEVNNEKSIAEAVQREVNKFFQQRDRRRRSRLADKD